LSEDKNKTGSEKQKVNEKEIEIDGLKLPEAEGEIAEDNELPEIEK
jgi:hypothetical protein